MSAETSWYQENRVIIVRIQGEFTIEEMAATNRQIIEYMRQGSARASKIHVIADIQAMNKMTVSLARINNTMTYLKEPILGWSVTVGMNPVMNYIASTVVQMARAKLHPVSSIEQAIIFLRSQDHHVSDILLPDYAPST